MSEDITAVAGEQTEQTAAEVKAFEAITSQEDFDSRIQARLDRERKKIPTDYEELKAKAQKFAEWEEANKTEAEKVQARLDVAEKRAVELESKALRAEVAAAKGVPTVLLSGSTLEELEASADALLTFRGEQKPAGPSSSALARTNATQKTDDFDTAIADARAARNFPLAITLQQQKAAALAERKD
jgi:predicted ribosome quality control (RQC) complex YloA/Tae2 family protein